MSLNIFSIKHVTDGKKKSEYLHEDLLNNFVDLCFVCETFLSEDIPDSYVAIDGFDIIRKDRMICKCSNPVCSNLHKGGGILYYVKSYISYHVFDSPPEYECLIVMFSLGSIKRRVILFGVYHPPNPIYDSQDFISFICYKVNDLSNDYADAVIILLGDLNQLNIDPIILNTELKYFNIAPTRGSAHLDKVLLSHSQYFVSIDAINTVTPTDHLAILLSPQVKTSPNRTPRSFYDTSFKNRAAFANAMEDIDFRFVFDSNSPDITDDFDTVIFETFKNCFPTVNVLMSDRDPAWVTPYIKHLLVLKNRAKRRGQLYKCQALEEKIRKHLTQNCKKGSKLWWKNIDNTTHRKYSNKKINYEVFDPELVNKALADRCTSDYTSFEQPYIDESDPRPEIPLAYVYELLRSCKKTASGPNNIPYWVYSEFADILAEPLHYIWNLIISTGKIPSSYKSANIMPLPKVNNASSIDDIRGIAVTNISARLHETAINNLFIKPSINDSLDPYQFGFRPRLGTVDALLSIQHYVSQVLNDNQGATVHCISIDFSKAFDSVRPDIFMQKLTLLFSNTYIKRWFYSFLTSRSQRLVWNGCPLKFLTTNSGCSQGTVSGPVIWNIYSNDLQVNRSGFDSIIGSAAPVFIKYADDTNCLVTCHSNSYSSDKLNSIWSFINSWSDHNSIRLNTNKTIHLRFHNINSDACCCGNQTFTVNTVQSHKILGVTFAHNGKFTDHGKNLVKSMRRNKYLLKDLKRHNAAKAEIDLVFDSLCISKILYCLPVYGSDINVIKKLNEYLQSSTKRGYTNKTYQTEELLQKTDSGMHSRIKINKSHPLHSILPTKAKNQRTGKAKVPRCRTQNLKSIFINRSL